jgi:hypothetical protein
MESEPAKYLVGRLRQALAEDDRTNTQDVDIKILQGRVYLFGNLESPERRAAAEQVARELVGPDMQVCNEICVVSFGESTQTETVP